MKKRNSNYYFNELNDLLTQSENVSEEMHPFFEKAEVFFKDGGEFLDKTEVVAGFDKGMVIYQEIAQKLSQLTPNVRVIGMHKKLVKQFFEYVDACQQMVVATENEDKEKFKLSENNQEVLSGLLSKTIDRIVKISMS